jgi:hypothetical protein
MLESQLEVAYLELEVELGDEHLRGREKDIWLEKRG